jgi:hypothetical protein
MKQIKKQREIDENNLNKKEKKCRGKSWEQKNGAIVNRKNGCKKERKLKKEA